MDNEKLEKLAELLSVNFDDFGKSEDDMEGLYIEALDAGEPVRIGTLEYAPSQVLKDTDPTAYRCGLSDFTGAGDYEEISGRYMNDEAMDELKEALKDAIGSL